MFGNQTCAMVMKHCATRSSVIRQINIEIRHKYKDTEKASYSEIPTSYPANCHTNLEEAKERLQNRVDLQGYPERMLNINQLEGQITHQRKTKNECWIILVSRGSSFDSKGYFKKSANFKLLSYFYYRIWCSKYYKNVQNLRQLEINWDNEQSWIIRYVNLDKCTEGAVVQPIYD